MNIVAVLLSAIGALLGALFLSNRKKNSAEALLINNNVAKQETKLDETIAKNDGLLEAEQAKQKEAEEKRNEDTSKSDADFFNSRK